MILINTEHLALISGGICEEGDPNCEIIEIEEIVNPLPEDDRDDNDENLYYIDPYLI